MLVRTVTVQITTKTEISNKLHFVLIPPLKHYLIAQQDSSHFLFSPGEWEATPASLSAVHHQTFYTHSFIYSFFLNFLVFYSFTLYDKQESKIHGGYVTCLDLSIRDSTPLLFLLYLIASQREFCFLSLVKCDVIHLSTLSLPMAIITEQWGQNPLHLLRT